MLGSGSVAVVGIKEPSNKESRCPEVDNLAGPVGLSMQSLALTLDTPYKELAQSKLLQKHYSDFIAILSVSAKERERSFPVCCDWNHCPSVEIITV